MNESIENSNILFYKLLGLGEIEFALINVIMIALIWLFAFIFKKIIIRKFTLQLRKAKLDVKGKVISGHALIRHTINFIAFVAAITSLKLNNPNLTYLGFLFTEIFSFGDADNEIKFVLRMKHILILIVLFFLNRIAINLMKVYFERRALRKKDFDEGSKFVYIQFSRYLITFVSIYIFLLTLKIELTTVLAAGAGLLLALALGLQDLFKDLVSGFVLLFEGAIKVGDIIEIKEAVGATPLVAKVLQINMRTTKIETRDSNIYIIPNSRLTSEYVENWNFGSSLTRFTIPLRVAYGSDMELVKSLLVEAALSHPKVKKNKDVFVRLLAFGDNGLELDLLFHADQNWRIEIIKSEIRFEIDRLFRTNGIVIPFPQRVVYGMK